MVEKERNVVIPTEKEEKAMSLTFKHISGPVIDAQQECVQFKLMNYQGWAFKTNNVSDCWAMLSDGKLVKVLNIVQSALGTSIVGKFFNPRFTTSLYETPLGSSCLGIYSVKTLTSVRSWPVEMIKCKLLVLPHKKRFVCCFLIVAVF